MKRFSISPKLTLKPAVSPNCDTDIAAKLRIEALKCGNEIEETRCPAGGLPESVK
jgi:hypothetical protein